MWKRRVVVFGLVFVTRFAPAQLVDDERILGRGDANSDGQVNLADASTITSYLFSGGPAPPCMNQADANNDGAVDSSDAVYILTFLYDGGPAPPSPGPFNTTCVADDAPYLGCTAAPCT